MSNTDFQNPALYPVVQDGRPIIDAYMHLAPAEKALVDAYLSTMAESAAAAGRALVEHLKVQAGGKQTLLYGRAAEVLERPHVKIAIAQRAAEISQKLELSTNKVLKEVANVAMSNMAHYVHLNEDGLPYIDLTNCSFDQMSAIQEITVEEFKDGRGENARDVRRVKLKLHSKLDALEKLMKFLQMYQPEQLNVNVNVNAQVLSANMEVSDVADYYAAKLKVGQ